MTVNKSSIKMVFPMGRNLKGGPFEVEEKESNILERWECYKKRRDFAKNFISIYLLIIKTVSVSYLFVDP